MHRSVLVLVAILFIACIVSISYIRSTYDTSEFEAKAKQLVGKNSDQIEPTLGPPGKRFAREEFNASERLDAEQSFVPKPVPHAEGPVWVYYMMPTIVIVYTKGGIVRSVYVGKT